MIYSRLTFSTYLIAALIGGAKGETKKNTSELMRGRPSGLRNLQSDGDDFFGNKDETDDVDKKTVLSLAEKSNNVFEDNFDELFGGGKMDTINDEGARIVVKVVVKTEESEKTRKPKPKKTRTPKPPRNPPTMSPTLEKDMAILQFNTQRPSRNPSGKPSTSPSMSPTGPPSSKPSKELPGICKIPERAEPRRSSKCSDARNQAYEEAMSLFQSDFDGCDCYNVGQFSKAAAKDLLEKKYKEDPKGNSRQEGVKKCARDGVERYITDAAEACIGPETCEEVGFLVTDLIITDFCEIASANRFNPKLLQECEQTANAVCEGDLFLALIDFLRDGYECPAKDMFNNAAEAKEYINEELRKQCGEKVKQMLYD